MDQLTIFDIMYPKYKITKPIRLIEFFAGYGSQALALKYLGVPFEHWKTCEWAVKSIQAYKDIHFANEEFKDTYMTKEQMVDFLYNKGISANYNEPMTREQINRLSEEQLEKIIKNIFITHNLVNIQQVHGEGNIKDFNKWQVRLEELGYKNYFQDLIATDYGIPQTRNRCFMVSILGDYSYTFPKPISLKLKLKDMLEDNVDEKYYLSDDLMKHIQKTAEEHEEYTQYDRYNGDLEMWCRVWKDKSPTLNTKCKDTKIYVRNKSLKETLEQNKIDDTCYIDTYNKRIDKEKSGTITTGVSFRNNTFLADSNLRIRKLTPKECFRLMGVKDEDFEKCAKNQSDSSLYHLAGDSIVVNVLIAIFGELLDIDWQTKLEEI